MPFGKMYTFWFMFPTVGNSNRKWQLSMILCLLCTNILICVSVYFDTICTVLIINNNSNDDNRHTGTIYSINKRKVYPTYELCAWSTCDYK